MTQINNNNLPSEIKFHNSTLKLIKTLTDNNNYLTDELTEYYTVIPSFLKPSPNGWFYTLPKNTILYMGPHPTEKNFNILILPSDIHQSDYTQYSILSDELNPSNFQYL